MVGMYQKVDDPGFNIIFRNFFEIFSICFPFFDSMGIWTRQCKRLETVHVTLLKKKHFLEIHLQVSTI